MGSCVVEWLGHRTWNSEVPGSIPALALELFLGSPEFNSSAALVSSQLVCILPVGIFDHVMSSSSL